MGTRIPNGADDLVARLSKIRAVVFDWDGVFNDGVKDEDGGSPFSEIGSTGVNMLRFGLWLKQGSLPVSAVITGQRNKFVQLFTAREKFHGAYMGYIDKRKAFDHLLATHGLAAEQVAFFFDEVIDLPVAERAGLRAMIGRSVSPLLERAVIARGQADLITKHSGGENGLREACELLLGAMGIYDEVVEHRASFSNEYQTYLALRTATELRTFAQDRKR